MMRAILILRIILNVVMKNDSDDNDKLFSIQKLMIMMVTISVITMIVKMYVNIYSSTLKTFRCSSSS